ncbi:MAG: single-stranded-DNA-specific exonuclease RecJ [candidate division WOR-3 bacterium]
MTWSIPESEPEIPVSLIQTTGLSQAALKLLVARGYQTPSAIRSLLSPGIDDLHDPWLLPDMAKAAQRLARAVRGKEGILIHGDYDVDGITGAALLDLTLRRVGLKPQVFLPDRIEQGYGLSRTGIIRAKESGCQVVLTVDCGTTDLEEAQFARDLGLDLIVTDHHELPPDTALPQACAVINPRRRDSAYPNPDLPGCGVAFKLAQALFTEMDIDPDAAFEHVELVGLAAVADVVPLTGENRVLARLGTTQLTRTNKIGLRQLIRQTNLAGHPLGTHEIGFIIAPRLNASGRIANAHTAYRLLVTDDEDEASQALAELEAANAQRRTLQEQVTKEIKAEVSSYSQLPHVLVLAREGWHPGVIGIVAGRITEEYYRPTIVINLDQDQGRGSGRSIPGFHLHRALEACASALEEFGGHEYAAGLIVRRANLDRFCALINQYAHKVLTPDMLIPRLVIDAKLRLADIDHSLLEVLRLLEPYGPGNPEAVFAAFGLQVVGYPRVVGADHLKFTVRQDSSIYPAIAYRRAQDLLRLQPGKPDHLDIAFQIKTRPFQGKTQTQLEVQDLVPR